MGRAGVTGDIGTHAYHLANFVTGLEMTRLRAEFHVCGAPKAMEDTAFMHVRYEGNVPGTLWVTQGCTWQLLRAAAARLWRDGRVGMGPGVSGAPQSGLSAA